MKTTSRVAALLAFVLAFAAPAVAAAFTTGNYKGKTAQTYRKHHHKKHRKISVHADSTAGQVSNLKFFTQGKCSDGGRSSGKQGPFTTNVDQNGHFSVRGTSPSGATHLKLNGTLSGNKANGTVKVVSHFNKNNQPDPNGKIRCSSGKVKWSAKRVGS